MSLSIINIKKLNATYHRFRLGSWNVQGLNCTHKQVEISEILHKNNIDLLAVQESWEVTGKSKFFVPGYTWFGKPRSKESCKNLKRGDGGVGFLVRDGLEEIISIINDVEYDESIWLKLSCGGRDKSM